MVYKKVAHGLAGAGGCKCPCCRPVGYNNKKRFFRMVKRIEKRLDKAYQNMVN